MAHELIFSIFQWLKKIKRIVSDIWKLHEIQMSVSIKFYWNAYRLIALHIIYSCFCPTMAEVSLQTLKYLLSGKSANSWSNTSSSLWPFKGVEQESEHWLGQWLSAETSWEVTPRPLPEMCLTQQMVREGGHTGGCEGQFLLFAAFHGAQQEAHALFWGRRPPSIETWVYTGRGHLVNSVRGEGPMQYEDGEDRWKPTVANKIAIVK